MTRTTVTNEQLRERLEIFAREQAEGETPEKREIAGIYASAFAELLAVREAQSVPVAGTCDQEVYNHGVSACMVDIPKHMAEEICRSLSLATGFRIDWHYFGGRVHIKALAPSAPAVPAIITHPVYKVIYDECGGFVESAANAQAIWDACRAAMLNHSGDSNNKVPAGFKLVPIEPTKQMVVAGQEEMDECIVSDFESDIDGNRYDLTEIASDAPFRIFNAMMAAAPTPTHE